VQTQSFMLGIMHMRAMVSHRQPMTNHLCAATITPMPLPILPDVPAPVDLLRLFHQTELQWARQIAQEATLESGTAIYSPDVPDFAEANALHDVAMPPGVTASQALDEAERFYADQGTRLHACILNPAAPADTRDAITAELQRRAWQRRQFDVMHTSSPRLPDHPPHEGLKIIPARASFRHTRQLIEQMIAEIGGPAVAEAWMLRYDDPHYDALIAIRDGRTIAHVGVLAVGEIGRIDDLFVAPDARGQGIGWVMLYRAIDLCLRSVYRHVMLSVAPDHEQAIGMYRRCGFERIGQFTSWRRPSM